MIKADLSIIKILLSPIGMFLIIFTSTAYGQDTTSLFHNPGVYVSTQLSKDGKPWITPFAWLYAGNYYSEVRLNYEDRETFSFYLGRSIKTDKKKEIEIIPMLGAVMGNVKGISMAGTVIITKKWLNAFIQNEYVSNLENRDESFFFNWTGITTPVKDGFGIGTGCKLTIEKSYRPVLQTGPMISFCKGSFTFEGYAYNFWESHPVWIIGLEFSK